LADAYIEQRRQSLVGDFDISSLMDDEDIAEDTGNAVDAD
jgi:hypothetical protein